MKEIKIRVHNRRYSIPNAWERLLPKQYMLLMGDLDRMARGELSVAMVRASYVCHIMDWDPAKIDEDGFSNLAWLAEQVDFIFNIAYPDSEVLAGLDPDTRRKLKKTPPERLPGLAMARYLSKIDYTYVLDSCFCAQLLPTIKVGKKKYRGYRIDTSFSTLTCSLTALQYIEARNLLGAPREMLPLLAAILYHPGAYSSESAHRLAKIFSTLPQLTLQAIAFNFQCFNNYLFSQTDFFILASGTATKISSIATGALETLYNLTADGMGDITGVEQMNVIKYLTVLRKKLIESIQSLSAAGIDNSEVAEKTGLPLQIINKVLK